MSDIIDNRLEGQMAGPKVLEPEAVGDGERGEGRGDDDKHLGPQGGLPGRSLHNQRLYRSAQELSI